MTGDSLNENPKMFMTSSMTISFPRQLAWLVSPCQTGAVEVLIPFPIPATTLPTNICGSLKAAVWRIAPTNMMMVPTRTVFLRPSRSPIQMVDIAPRKQPMS